MNRYLLLIFALFCCLTGHAQGFFAPGKGSLDASFSFNKNDLYHSGYPSQFGALSARQNFSVANIPFTVNGFYSSMNNVNNNGLFPNYFNISFNSNDFRKDMLEKVNYEYEKTYLTEAAKKRKKMYLLSQSQQIDSALVTYNENALNDLIGSYELQKVKQSDPDSIEYYSTILSEMYDYRDSWANLKMLKAKNDSISKGIEPNDSIINEYSPFNLNDFNEKKNDIKNIYPATKAERLAMSLDRFNAGRFPFVTHRFVSQSSFVDGIDIKVDPSRFSLSALYGKLSTINLPYLYTVNPENSVIAGGSFGFDLSSTGTEIFTYIINKDRQNINDIIGVIHNTEISKKIGLTLVLSGSQYNTGDDINTNEFSSESLPLEYPYSSDNFVYNIFFQKKSLDFITGYAFDGKLNFSGIIRENRLFAGYESVSPTYYSLASPFLIKDISAICVGTEQSFLKNVLKINITQRIREKQTSDLYAYSAGWQSTSIRASYRPSEFFNINTLYQISIRSSENIKDNNHIFNISCFYTWKYLANTSHLFQIFYVEHPGTSTLWNLNYIFTLPVISVLDISIGLNTHFQNSNEYKSLRSDITFHPGKKTSHILTGTMSFDDVCKEYYGGYSFRINLTKNFIADLMAGYGTFVFVDPSWEVIENKSSLTGTIKLMYLW